ncbi:MAG: HAMP domain-containing histidine kinase [Acidobacteriales bacterium]|nr:HAMP domain-containing histidine kinase [Terriglobales bacterium]
MPARPITSFACGVALVLAFALAPSIFPSPFFRTAMGNLVPLLVATATVVLTARNAFDSRGHTRLFWGLMTAGMAMWWFNQAGWAWFEVVLRKPVPDPFEGDVVLFLHFVPIMAAVAIRPQRADDREGLLPSTLNVVILLVWWMIVYAFAVFPDEYLTTNVPVYSLRWDMLYLAEGLILIAVSGWSFLTSSGPWRTLYRNILLATVVYAFSAETINAAIARGTYASGGIYDIPFLMALLGFFWVAVMGRHCLRETQATPSVPRSGALAPHLLKLALLSLPLMGYWALFMGASQPYLRQVRFTVAMGGVATLAFFVFLKQHLLDRKLVQLLKQSRSSYDNLQRLQGRAVQQAKLASLGELVAMAASELEYPLSTILGSSERLAASSNLSREQLATAQKIGQQARRTRDLVNDLLSFSQQTPGEKVPLELKPLLQRAVQMEGFKLDNRDISFSVESADPLPRVLGNSNQLLQAFLQIVENAVDALQEADGGRLQVSLRHEANEVVIEFADTGPGLRDPERVFDPFYTTKPVGKGTGLGLSATYGVIQDHKGQITCYNRPEGGAAFEIRLPALKVGTPLTEAARA